METLKDKKIAKELTDAEIIKKASEYYFCLPGDCSKHRAEAVAVELAKWVRDQFALNEQIDTAPTVRDELIKFADWYYKKSQGWPIQNEIIDEYLSSTANQPKETV